MQLEEAHAPYRLTTYRLFQTFDTGSEVDVHAWGPMNSSSQ